MCAMLLGNPFGEVRGKLAGNVFSRNGHGAYLREYVVGLNPNTVAQATARSSFSNVSSQFSSLTASQRARWSEYAKSIFVPRENSHSMRYNGYQAFVSCAMANLRSRNLNRHWDFLLDGYAPTVSWKVIDWATNVDEPQVSSKVVSARTIYDKVLPFTLKTADYWLSGKCSFTIKLGQDSNTWSFNYFKDENGNQNGFALYMSNPFKGENYFVQNPLYRCVGFFKPWQTTIVPGAPFTFNELEYITNDSFNLAKYKSQPVSGDWVRLTLYTIDLYGQMRRVGSIDREVIP